MLAHSKFITTPAIVWILLALAYIPAQASPFVVSDPYPAAQNPKPTHCQLLIDDATTAPDTPVAADLTGVYCKIDINSVPVGAHTVKAKYIIIEPVWGRLESALSAPLNFTRPALPAPPAGTILAP